MALSENAVCSSHADIFTGEKLMRPIDKAVKKDTTVLRTGTKKRRTGIAFPFLLHGKHNGSSGTHGNDGSSPPPHSCALFV